jgi:hypothetical protein
VAVRNGRNKRFHPVKIQLVGLQQGNCFDTLRGAMKHSLKFSFLVGAVLSASVQSLTATNLVVNGGFEINGGIGELGNTTPGTTTVGTWTVGATIPNAAPTPANAAPFDFIMNSGATTTGTPTVYGTTYLYGSNGFKVSPGGGDFLGADGGYASAPISQTIGGLTIGDKYTLSYDWAAAQLTTCNGMGAPCLGATQDQWQVTFGGQTVDEPTPAYPLPNKGFSGWMNESLTFTAMSTSQVLTFLAQGTPIGQPPFLLLDDVSLTANGSAPSAAPEPGSVVLMAGGILSLIGAARWRKNRR